MSDSEEENILFLQLVVLLKMNKKKKRKRERCVQELFRKQEEKGTFNNLIQEIKLASRESLICDLFAIYLLSLIQSSSC